MQVKSKFNIKIDNMVLKCHNFILKNGNNEEIKCFIIKFKLSSGETKTSNTNFLYYNIRIKLFKELYFLSWPVETEYNILKEKLKIENFSIRTIEGIFQDFFIALFMANILSVAMHNTQPIIDEERKDKDNKYKYKLNIS